GLGGERGARLRGRAGRLGDVHRSSGHRSAPSPADRGTRVTEQRAHFVGVDVGGTFTDVVLADSTGGVTIGKVLTTPDDPRRGIVEGIRHVLGRAAVDPGAVSRVVHGTTLATSVVAQRTAAPIALVATEGFGDLLRLGREAR